MVYRSIRPLLFRMDPEQAHALTIGLLRLAGALPVIQPTLRRYFAGVDHPVEAFGLKFKNPIGLAAGYDKDGLAWRGLACLGFSHIEVGTVTPMAQPGNPRPRVFRLVEDQALINRMGFPGRGADFVASKIKSSRPAGLVLGVNIGKNKDTPLEKAVNDYVTLVRVFAGLADYLVINVSSPNTIGLRRLMARQVLQVLLDEIAQERRAILQEHSELTRVPILVKLAPDMTDEELDDAVDVLLDTGMDGVIATNTSLQREGLVSAYSKETGGLSGTPLFSRSLAVVKKIQQRTQGRLPIVGVGGISNPTGAQLMLDAGARLVQIYSGLIYQGPGLVKQILRAV